MNIKQILFFGRDGDLLYEVQPPFREPLLELDSNKSLPFRDGCLSFDRKPTGVELKNYFQSIYRSWKHFGPFGDIIAVKELVIGEKYYYLLDYIGRLAFVKAATAVDLMTFIKTKKGNFFVGIKRRNEPGKGKIAFPGGFIDVRGYHLDTPLETVIHEAKEEIKLNIQVCTASDLNSYNPAKIPVFIDYDNRQIFGELINVGIFPTGDSEKILSTGLKRVYTTTVFALMLDMTNTWLGENGIGNWLKAGDDAAELMIVDLKGFPKIEFGLEHHQKIYDELLKQIFGVLM